jgi:hypothetical protein
LRHSYRIVYNAFRVAQGRIAQQQGVAPEDLSPTKLFPKLAEASSNLAGAEEALLAVRRLNSGVKLRERRPEADEINLGAMGLKSYY